MARVLVAVAVFALATLLAASPLAAVAGKWTPEQILQHDPEWLAELGLELPPQALWSPEGGGLLEAVVQIGGCSSGFVSAEGLILTNHHCAFGVLQQHSSAERDLITGGFLAADRGAELPATGVRATIPHAFRDVTAEIEAAVPSGADDRARYQAIEDKEKQLIAACEAKPSRRCRVAAYDQGVRYVLVEALEYPDTRLVYAPPRAVGEYGGDVDNWMWPRHTGDFALLRVYADADNQPAAPAEGNRPYRPSRYLEVSTAGVHAGDFVMVVGYPGRTYRSLIAAEMAERAERYFPARARLYRAWMDVMEDAAAQDEAARIALAGRVKGLANREKNSRGQVAGIERGALLAKKRAFEEQVRSWAAERPEHRAAVAAYDELSRLVAAADATWERDFLLAHANAGPLPLGLALTLARWSEEKAKPDAERDPAFQERNVERILVRHRRNQSQLHTATETRLLADWLRRAAALPADQRIAAVDALLGTAGAAPVEERAAALIAGTGVLDLDARDAMFAASREELVARQDPLLAFAFDLAAEVEALEEEDKRRDGARSRLRPRWRRAVEAFVGKPVDFDANGTLRVSLAHVQGYEPQEAVTMLPQTTFAGVVAKHTGDEPFDASVVLDLAAAATASRWADGELGSVPVAFLATGDTTGGSSGSPVLDARGRLVGVNFDRVWENIANDFGYNPAIARNISVDVRYLLWLLEARALPGSRRLLSELGVEATP